MPQKSPGTLTSPRDQALKIGTAPQGFDNGDEYDAQAGVPKSMAGGVYKDSAEGLPDDVKLPQGNLPQAPDPSPFKLSGGA